MAGRKPARPCEADDTQVERFMQAIRSADRRALVALLQRGLAAEAVPAAQAEGSRITVTRVQGAAWPAWRIELGGVVLAVVPQPHLAWWTGDCDDAASTMAERLTAG